MHSLYSKCMLVIMVQKCVRVKMILNWSIACLHSTIYCYANWKWNHIDSGIIKMHVVTTFLMFCYSHVDLYFLSVHLTRLKFVCVNFGRFWLSVDFKWPAGISTHSILHNLHDLIFFFQNCKVVCVFFIPIGNPKFLTLKDSPTISVIYWIVYKI